MAPGSTRGQLVNPTPIPPGLEYLWEWFLDLSAAGRQYGPSGMPMLLSNSEILAWCTLQGLTLEPWELRTVKLIDLMLIGELRQSKDG